MIESKWLDKWFMEIRNVNDTIVAQWRQTVMKIHGVPLTAWNYRNFHKIGSVYGRVISTDYSNYDCAKVMIITDCLFKVNCKLHLKIDGVHYPISTFEYDGHPCKKSPTKPGDISHQPDDERNSRNTSPSLDSLENVSPTLGIPNGALNISVRENDEKSSSPHSTTVPHAKIADAPTVGSYMQTLKTPQSPHLKKNPLLAHSSYPIFQWTDPSQSHVPKPNEAENLAPPQIQSNTNSQSIPTPPHPHPPSPITTSNKFGPLLPRNKPVPSSLSSLSGPMFPRALKTISLPSQNQPMKKRETRN